LGTASASRKPEQAPEEGYWQDFHNAIEANRNFTLDFLNKKATKM
jgi:hypothetical protein